jgi:hypothetical protein
MTLHIFQSGSVHFIKQAIEFWLVVGNEEYEILEKVAMLEENDLPVPQDYVCENYISGIFNCYYTT